jgi:hypothetical protein
MRFIFVSVAVFISALTLALVLNPDNRQELKRGIETLRKIDGWAPAPAEVGLAEPARRLAFVNEYIRELGVNDRLRRQAESELKEPGANPTAAMVRGSTRIVLELAAQQSMLRGMKLSGRFADVPGSIAEFYDWAIKTHKDFIALGDALAAGPRPGVDYQAVAAKAPKLTAMIDHIDRALFDATPLIFAALIDEKPDKEGHMSRLTITRAQRDSLVKSLQLSFGARMDAADQNHLVGSATLLRDFLTKNGYNFSDEGL